MCIARTSSYRFRFWFAESTIALRSASVSSMPESFIASVTISSVIVLLPASSMRAQTTPGARRLERLRVEGKHRAQRGSLPIVGLDARQAQLDQLLRGQRAGVEGMVDIGNRQRVEVDGFRRAGRGQRGGEREEPRMSLHG